MHSCAPHAALALLFGLCAAADAALAADPETLPAVVVNATRLHAVPGFDTPASLDVVDLGRDSARADANISERLSGVPGLAARERQNLAQDTQLSLRGFGARSTFGVRGVRLYVDGIPASMPDGQGQLAHFNVLGGERVEVMRGPFSALYGNSSGGVVQLWSAQGQAGDPWRVRASSGSDRTTTLGVQLLGAGPALAYNLAASHLRTDGSRQHSAARRDTLNARLDLPMDEDHRLSLVVNALDLPEARDPLGLTAAQVRQDPGQATAAATDFNTRKSVRQHQGGVRYEWQWNTANRLQLQAYTGRRAVAQFLPLPVAAQANPLNAGGVIDLDSDYGGADLRWSWQGELGARPLQFTLGTRQDRQRQQRRGYENFVGARLGVRGALRRDEANRVDNLDQYAQAWWQLAPRWSLLAGLRHSVVEFQARDRFVSALNPDDSGRVRFHNTAPVAGLMFKPSADLRLYASAGGGFETPTFNELGYRADGGAGPAFDLRPAISRNFELGVKWRDTTPARVEAAVFRADTDDELAVARNVGGRSSFRNVGRARRQGVEASAEFALNPQWQLQLAYTWLDARFRDAFLVCTGAGCTVPATTVAAGARIPGVARQQFFARLQWRGAVWSAALEANANSRLVVNDSASEAAPGYALVNLEAARSWSLPSGPLRLFARVDNVLDRAYIGSVIVNEGNGRYYEPAPGRGFVLGAQWQWAR